MRVMAMDEPDVDPDMALQHRDMRLEDTAASTSSPSPPQNSRSNADQGMEFLEQDLHDITIAKDYIVTLKAMLASVSSQKDSLRANLDFLRRENSMLTDKLDIMSTNFQRQANHLDLECREKQQLDTECFLLGEKVLLEFLDFTKTDKIEFKMQNYVQEMKMVSSHLELERTAREQTEVNLSIGLQILNFAYRLG